MTSPLQTRVEVRSLPVRRVLLLAQLPPPVHGVTMTTERVRRLVAEGGTADVVHQWGGSARSLADVDRRSFGKFQEFAALNLALARQVLAGDRFEIAYLTFVPWTHAALRDGIVAWWAKRLAERTLVHLHGEGLEQVTTGRGIKAALLRRMLRGTELIAITRRAVVTATASGLFTAVHHLPNAAPDPGPPAPRAAGPLRVAFLGNLDPRKGVLRFVDVIEQVVREGHDVIGGIAGGSTRHLTVEGLRTQIAERGLAGRITVHGPVHGAEKDRFLAVHDVLLYLSAHDHAPLVVIEALSHGLVPIVQHTGGVAEIAGPRFSDNVMPAKVPDADLIARAAAVVAGYAVQPAAIERDRAAARERYLVSFTEAAFARNLAAVVKAPPSTATLGVNAGLPRNVRSQLPSAVKAPIFAVIRRTGAALSRGELPERVAIYFHALDPHDRVALETAVGVLRDRGYRFVSMDIYTDPSQSGRLCNVSFDDNYRSWHAALPLFERLGLSATFYVNTLPFRDCCPKGEIDAYFRRLDYAGEAVSLTTGELREIAAAGHEIGCHTHSHLLLADVARASWDAEITASKRLLEAIIGQSVRHFSWPYGMPRHITAEQKTFCLGAGFRTLSGATPGLLHQGIADPADIPRTGWRHDRSIADNMADLVVDGRLFTKLTGRSIVG